MTKPQRSQAEEAVGRAAAHFAAALSELQQNAVEPGLESARQELVASRQSMELPVRRVESQLAEEREERQMLAGRLKSLATSLDRLVGHLQALSQLLTGMLERTQQLTAEAQPPQEEPTFMPGGEGVFLKLVGVPGFQEMMDIQKALIALDPVVGVSVEHFQEGDARMLVHLQAAITGPALASALRESTGHALAVEESRPELQRLRLKLIPS